jgi:hypothetical protein
MASTPIGPPNPHDEDAEQARWHAVYSAREAFYRDKFGPLPEDILKIGHLFGVWPGGGIFVIPATNLGADAWVYTTFGFSNSDMPTTMSISNVEAEHDNQGRLTRSSGRLQAKERAIAPAGAAGYGYEMLVLTKENSEWPLWFLQWTANAELLNDVGILSRVEKYEGLTIEQIKVGGDDSINVLIARAQPPLPSGASLPNGNLGLLIATVITDQEMHWSMKNGRVPLLAKLRDASVGQFSVRGRPSVVS